MHNQFRSLAEQDTILREAMYRHLEDPEKPNPLAAVALFEDYEKDMKKANGELWEVKSTTTRALFAAALGAAGLFERAEEQYLNLREQSGLQWAYTKEIDAIQEAMMKTKKPAQDTQNESTAATTEDIDEPIAA